MTQIIAGLALLVSVIALFYARKQAQAAKVLTDDVKRLRHERARPRIEISAEQLGDEVRLVATNEELDAVDSVEVQLTAVKNDPPRDARLRLLPAIQTWSGGRSPGSRPRGPRSASPGCSPVRSRS
jgi:hypothetical protein